MHGAVLKILAGSALATVALSATPAAASVTFDTNASTLSCNGVVGCVQNTATSVSMNGLTLTYGAGLGIGIDPPSNINLGSLTAAGAGPFNVAGLLLTIAINQTVPGGSGSIGSSSLAGIITSSASSASISWLSPSVTINGYIYTVSNNPLAIVAPNSGGFTSIQGTVQAVPEPATWGLMLLGFAGIGFAMRRRRHPALAQLA